MIDEFPQMGYESEIATHFRQCIHSNIHTQYTTTATDTKKVKKMQRVIILFAPPSLIIIRMIPSVLAAVLDIWYQGGLISIYMYKLSQEWKIITEKKVAKIITNICMKKILAIEANSPLLSQKYHFSPRFSSQCIADEKN